MGKVVLLSNYEGSKRPKLKWIDVPQLKVTVAADMPDAVDAATLKLMVNAATRYVDGRFGDAFDRVRDFDKIIEKTLKAIDKLKNKTDDKSKKEIVRLEKEGKAQLRALGLLDKLFVDINKDIQAKVTEAVVAEFEKWKAQDKALRNHKIKLAVKLVGLGTLALTAAGITTLAAAASVAGTIAGGVATGTGVGAAGGVPLIVGSVTTGFAIVGVGVTALSGVIAAIVKVAKAAKAEMQGEKVTRAALVSALTALTYKIEKEQARSALNSVPEKSGIKGKIKGAVKKALKPKELLAQIASAVKNEATAVEKAKAAHLRSLIKVRQTAVSMAQSVQRAEASIKDLNGKIAKVSADIAKAEKQGAPLDKKAVKSLRDLDQDLKHYQVKQSAYAPEIDRLTSLVISGEKIHADCDKAIADFKAGKKVDIARVAKLIEKLEDNQKFVDGAVAVASAGVVLVKNGAKAGKEFAKLAA